MIICLCWPMGSAPFPHASADAAKSGIEGSSLHCPHSVRALSVRPRARRSCGCGCVASTIPAAGVDARSRVDRSALQEPMPATNPRSSCLTKQAAPNPYTTTLPSLCTLLPILPQSSCLATMSFALTSLELFSRPTYLPPWHSSSNPPASTLGGVGSICSIRQLRSWDEHSHIRISLPNYG